MRRGGSAVVIGASIGGLLAARVLSETFETVTVFDRDELPTTGTVRRGVPQGHQAHGLLARGRQIVDELFPGISAELVERGATDLDVQLEGRWYNDGRLLRGAASQLRGLSLSRPLLEDHLRTRVAALTGVTLRPRSEVLGLLSDESRRRVTGVRALLDGTEQEIAADLVVDASGRGNRGTVWLTELGYQPAPEERVDPDLVYATRAYRRKPGDSDMVAILVGSTVAKPRSGIALWTEGAQWQITLTGMGKDTPPADPDEFDAFAAGLPRPDLYELIQRLEPVGPPHRMRIHASLRRRYERLRAFPSGYLAFADALCQFNPAYGQGMTVAASEAIVLRDCLARGRDDLARRFFRAASKVVDVPWDIAVGADLRFPSVQGRRTARIKFINAYIERVHAAAETDPVVGNAFLSVAHLVAPPQLLFAPRILARVLLRRYRPSLDSTDATHGKSLAAASRS